MLKRSIDITLSALVLILASPVFLVIAVAIIIDSGFPVFFTQTRVGQGGRQFKLYKFRTMKTSPQVAVEVESGLTRAELQAKRQNFATTSVGDTRITRVGKILRKTHLDELPQFLNVQLGDMSLVGPRPDTPVQEGDYMPHRWRMRHMVRPGITGLAQVNPKRVKNTLQKLAWEMLYVKHQSLWLDMAILWKTFLKVFKADSF